ncbi:TonB-dependent receptor [Pseudoxanthomonas sp. CF125]|uniref:TonB-dependent receptor n=1 Tax=Pseudoxanthomonas sp. CF125 TaxID=1855303 RepID=UPI0008824549|nr:TonB-dependent receptor [Pseudoxanthomonas sp. CF125]SDR17386.1 iron complex outermembrane recepter protein [Pseudoxanthomonas sp. CF125]
MNCKKSILSAAIVASLSFAAQLHAQETSTTTQTTEDATDLGTITVVGIRGSIEKSLEAKRDSDSRVEVITSEDIGKMPDKNVADSLSRVPGVNISAASANEGAFDENDRVSMRGTSPSLTQTLIDGHNVASGDWFVLNQTGTVGRSVSYSLLPAELVDRVVVRKSSEAKLVEGGAVGSIDIVTRNPLNFDEGFSIFGSVGAVHAELPGKTDPQISVLGNWKNADGSFGLTVQAFSEERHLRRDGQELLGYEAIGANTAAGVAHPDLVGVFFPTLVGSALFEQERKRTGGMITAQFKPTDTVELEANYFRSDMKADNYNRNYMLWGSRIINGTNGANGQVPLPGYVIRNNTLVQAEFAATPGVDPANAFGIYDQISRPGAKSSTEFFSVDGKWDVSDKLTFSGQIGTSEGHGETPTQDVAEWDVGLNSGAGWGLHGVGAADWHLGNANTGVPGTPGTDYRLDWIFGFQDIDVVDEEDWAKLDGKYFVDDSVLDSIEFGVRNARHKRNLDQVTAQGPDFSGGPDPFDPANWPNGFQNYPGDFGDGLGGNFPRNIWYFSPGQLAIFNQMTNRDPVSRFFFPGAYGLEETSSAAYTQFNFSGERWTANLGVRFVRTEEEVTNYVNADPLDPAAITTSAFGAFKKVLTTNTYNDWLPSANFKYNLNDDMVLRLAASRTLTRPDFSALAGAVSLTPPAAVGGIGTGTGGNPQLEPIISTNLDATFEWYYAERALFSVGVFYMDIDNYVALGTDRQAYFTIDAQRPQGELIQYDLTVPVSSSAKVKGLELAWEQPFGDHFGVFANYTYADGDTDDGTAMLGTSENTYNVGAYFENDKFNARVNYNYRSEFFSGLDRASAFYQDEIDNVSASFGYQITDNFSLALDLMNLNNPKTKYYAENKDRPRSIYENGRQYYLNFRFKF